MGSEVPCDPLEQGHQALRELTHLVDQLVASSTADEPSDVETQLDPSNAADKTPEQLSSLDALPSVRDPFLSEAGHTFLP